MKYFLRSLVVAALLLFSGVVTPQGIPFPGFVVVSAPTYGTISQTQWNNGFQGGTVYGIGSATVEYVTAPNSATGGMAAGDLLVCVAHLGNTTNTLSITDDLTDAGSSWTNAKSVVETTNTGTRMETWYRTLGSTANTNRTVTATEVGGSSSQVTVTCGQFHTTSGSFYLEASSSNSTGNNGVFDPGNVTATSTSTLVVVHGLSAYSGGRPDATSPYTRPSRNSSGTWDMTVFTNIFTSSGSKSTSQTVPSGTGPWAATAVGFEAH